MEYLMVTSWSGHWDNVAEEPYYTEGMLKRLDAREVERSESVPTTLLKFGKNPRRPERAWRGEVTFTRRGPDKKGRPAVFFRITRLLEVKFPPEYVSCDDGWYPLSDAPPRDDGEEAQLKPSFFEMLAGTRHPEEFERLTYYLLRLLGVQTTYRYVRQAGQADGLFLHGSLAVIYDCTLSDNFETEKATQIDNYSSQLKSGRVQYERKGRLRSHDVKSCQKQVWLVTRGRSRTIREVDAVVVKEIAVSDLQDIYHARLREDLDASELEGRLRSLGE